MNEAMDKLCEDQAKWRAMQMVLEELPGYAIDCSSGREMYNFIMSCINGDEE